MEDLAIGVIRTLLWAINKAVLVPMDSLYKLVIQIASMDIWTKFTDVNGVPLMERFWKISVMFLVVAILFRILAYFISGLKDIKKIVEEDIAKKIVIIFLTIFLVSFLPTLMKNIGYVSSYATSNILVMFGGDAQTSPSAFILTACDDSHSTYWIDNDGVAEGITSNNFVSLDDIDDINEKDGGVYTHFSSLHFFFISLLVSIYMFIQLVAVALDTSKRWFEIVVIIYFSFIPISSLIDEGDGFKEWLKYLTFAYLSNYAELFIMILGMIFSLALKDEGVMVQIIMLIGGFLFAQQGSTYLARFMGIDSSGSTLQQLSQISQIASFARPVAHIAGGIAQTALNAGKKIVSNTANLTSRGIGRALGGVGANNYGKLQTTISSSSEYNNSNRDSSAEGAIQRSGNTNFNNAINTQLASGNNGPFSRLAATQGQAAGPISANNLQTQASQYLNSNLRVTRTDTYSSNVAWKDSSPIKKVFDYGERGNSIRHMAARGVGNTATRLYTNSLRKYQRRKGMI